ncbi:2-succinyl-5-enolpyruvyl-6-hydroxy-3-cyclohexene-1-carboxylic-acid synthase [Ekhidna sp.]|uniref:2-succinyl-5-enolpyruvyl-6-hydroxy-3- cyclohexene-1-carboxylic-acid synthase n=1 Tax=Ekhidna sp. TaxID=2608089 RepID=UPI00351730C9
MLHPPVFNSSQVCAQLGVKHAVMSPGSRNAPLTISFARQEKIKKWIIPDERSAGFIALGIAQQTKTPVVLCCTSGSALLNYAPAIAEAYYREIPLIVLSADRPPELIDQRDGQTIRQYEALKNHVKGSWKLPTILSDIDEEKYTLELIDAIQVSQNLPQGPVHINIPFKEPFYPTPDQDLKFEDIALPESEVSIIKSEIDLNISDFRKILILVGQHSKDIDLSLKLQGVSEKIPIIKSPLNNLNVGLDHVDAFIEAQSELKPDLLITSGLSVLSKKLKTFLRQHKPSRHIHFDPGGVKVDTYGTNPQYIKRDLSDFLSQLKANEVDTKYLKDWQKFEKTTKTAIMDFIPQTSYSETKVAHTILASIPEQSFLHLSNSMPVRYADLFGVKKNIEVYSNRGTSGIDGCTSTMIGSALVNDNLHVLLTGDLAFLYDRNAFFHNHLPANIRIIVLNNQGGGIFRLIEGPVRLPELEDYFETRHNRTAEYICAENDLEYLPIKDEQSLDSVLQSFYQPSVKGKVLEVFTDPKTNQEQYKKLKQFIHERINN